MSMDPRASVMRCLRPVLSGDGRARYACNWCRVCMAAHGAEWSARLRLEVMASGWPLVVRLSYSDEFLPSNGLPSVVDFELGWRRIRSALRESYGVTVRFYAVAELGELKGRPHYHALVFCLPERVFVEVSRFNKGFGVLKVQDVIEAAWRLGQVNAEAARDAGTACGYLTQYFEKGRELQRVERERARDALSDAELRRLKGQRKRYLPGERVVWFHRMTPGLSSGAVGAVVDAVSDAVGRASVARAGDVPRLLRFGGAPVPLPRYVRRKVRQAVGVDAARTPAAVAESVEMAARLADAGSARKLRQRCGHVDSDVAEAAARRVESRRLRCRRG